MVSKARLDLPEPDSPVNTIMASRGRSSETSFRLCSRAPRTTSRSATAPLSTGSGNGYRDRLAMVARGSDISGAPRVAPRAGTVRRPRPGSAPSSYQALIRSPLCPPRSLHDSALPGSVPLEIGRGAGPKPGGLLVQVDGRGQVLGGQAQRLEHGDLVVVRSPGRGPGEQLAELR